MLYRVAIVSTVAKYVFILQKIKLLLVFLFFANLNLFSQVEISNVALNIGKSVNVNVTSDLKIEDDVEFVNNGILDIVSKNDIEVWYDANEAKSYLGKLFLRGTGDVTFLSTNTNTEVNRLVVDCRNLDIESNLTVLNNLEFKKGIIDVCTDCVLSLSNSSSNSLVYAEDPARYIKGYFRRGVNPNESFIFPIGGDDGLCCLKFDDISCDDNVKVGYIPFEDELIVGKKNYSKAVRGLWDVCCEKDDFNYSLEINLKNVLKNCYDDVKYTFLRVDYLSAPNELNELTSELNTLNYPLLKTNETNPVCKYLLVSGDKFKIVNMVVASGAGGGVFKLPDVDGIEWGELMVMDGQGKRIFHAHKYMNDFSVNDLMVGTYFYKLTYTTRQGRKCIINNIIEVVYEK